MNPKDFLQVDTNDIDKGLLRSLKNKIEDKPATEHTVEVIEESLINDLEEEC